MLFKETIRRVSGDYNPEQIRAWAADEIDLAAWTERFRGRFAVVAIDGEQFAGFTELEDNGHSDCFYVSADHQREGIGRQLLAAIVKHSAKASRGSISKRASQRYHSLRRKVFEQSPSKWVTARCRV